MTTLFRIRIANEDHARQGAGRILANCHRESSLGFYFTTTDGIFGLLGFTVTVCQDRAGVDESIQKAKDWIANNAANTGAGAPQVSDGAVIVHLK